MEIIKRNTNLAYQIDEAWARVTDSSNEANVPRFKKLTYKEYNEGWLFEEAKLS